MAKVFERMVNRRLKEFLESNSLLDHRQHAFRHGFGTSTYFATLGDVLKEAYDLGHHIEIVSLDISKAFNRTWTPAVLSKLAGWGLNGHILHFIRNFLTDRSFRVTVGNTESRRFGEETGVPQGSVIAVTLFLVAMNGVFERLPRHIHIFVYADDVLIVSTGPTLARTKRYAQLAVNAVVKWTDAMGFQLSAKKSIRCHVCSSNHRVNHTPITIHDQPIPTRKSVRVLGVLIDRKLSFDQHFLQVKKDCRSRLNLIKTISRPHRSNNREVRFRVARAIIDSRLFYGTEITCIASEKLVKILAPVFNNYVRTVSGLLPSTPADAACVEAGILPFRYRLHVSIVTKAVSFTAKTSGNQRVFLLEEGNRTLRSAADVDLPPVAKVHWHGERSWHLPHTLFDSRIKDRFRAGDASVVLRRSVAELLGNNYKNHTHRYTDGSLSRSGVGIGIFGDNVAESSSLPPQCSVFSAEAAAIFRAATLPATKPILILTDSHSVIQALSSESPKHPWIQAIIKYAPSNTVYSWIPGHCGVPGNESADQLAGNGPSGQSFTDKVPLQDLQRWIAKTFRTAWEAEWFQSRTAFIRKVKGTTEAWKDLDNLRDQRVISRLRTGHSKLYYNFGGLPFRKSCAICGVPSTVEHILCDCPEFQDLRAAFDLTPSIRNLLGDDTPTSAVLISFLKEAKLYHSV